MSEILEAIVPLIEQGGTYAFWLAVIYLLVAPLKVAIGFAGAIGIAFLVAATIRYSIINPPTTTCWSCDYELKQKAEARIRKEARDLYPK